MPDNQYYFNSSFHEAAKPAKPLEYMEDISNDEIYEVNRFGFHSKDGSEGYRVASVLVYTIDQLSPEDREECYKQSPLESLKEQQRQVHRDFENDGLS